ncbi:MAG: oligosaccharide flippase family protein [bacterium]|nr:oligosaccharide flippase family protein [bacterium]MDZ4344132.1 oligosaccharide flippase family protein [Candidatus Binatia bacterium]
MSQSILTNTAVATFGRIVNISLGIVATALITRFLGATSYGSYILLFSFGAIIQLLADFGLYLTLTKEIARNPSANKIISSAISLRLFLLILAFFLGAIATVFIPALSGLLYVFIFAGIGLVFQSLSQLLMGVFQYRGEIWRAVAGDLLGRTVQIAAIFWVGQAHASVTAMVVIFSAGAGAAFIGHQFLLPAGFSWRPRVDWPAWKQLLSASWPLGAMLLLNAVYFRVDTIILSFFRPAQEVGWYGLAYRIIESALFFPAMFGGLLLPRLSEALSKRNRPQAAGFITEGFRLLFVVAALAVTVLLAVSPGIINLISGRQYAAAAPLLAILSLALAFMFIGNLFGFSLVALNKQSVLLKLYLGLIFFNLVTNLMFIPRWGAAAAAWTTVGTEILSVVIAGAYVYRLLPFTLGVLFIIKTLFTALATFALLSFTTGSLPVIFQLIIAPPFFLAVASFLRLVSAEDLTLLRAARGNK